ncbi:peptidoglycan-recognition protein SB1-like [Lycorma delicatula]|uniref:peptidoglycan-recognition protein SB1-like n=1 Tax=Lycorma delicatula TaxID=130591 RepID=UPI003F519AA9
MEIIKMNSLFFIIGTICSNQAAIIKRNQDERKDMTGQSSNKNTIKIITREEWGAKPPKKVVPLSLPVPEVVIHHSYLPKVCNTTQQCIAAMQNMQHFHQDIRHWDDIGYNFAIGGDGNIYEGRGWNAVGSHVRNYNSISLGIVLIGDYTKTDPSTEMQDKAQALIEFGVQNNYIQKDYPLYGHRQLGSTSCPGDKFYETLKTWPHWKLK